MHLQNPPVLSKHPAPSAAGEVRKKDERTQDQPGLRAMTRRYSESTTMVSSVAWFCAA